ncbi:MAG: ABC transporter ATP-binding protein/permease [Alphaproteobacteria bacterium]|jgi:ABC-type transport system involved in Fe-S cluster assembly fused permease/ATPase subunit|nr:ABC transporter ATP-binding protein/permease [Alphaproteobacteria bacterium]
MPPQQAASPDEASPRILSAIGRVWGLIGGLSHPGMRLRLGIAIALTLLAKAVAVGAPLVLAQGVNALAENAAASAMGPFVLAVVAWGLLRFFSQAGPQVRDAVFQPISEEAQRRAGVRVFGHVHALSVRFHQAKRTGSLHRTIERGVRAIDFQLRFLAFNIGPTILELLLAAAVLGVTYGAAFSAIAVLTVVIYGAVTLWITEWRLQYRRELNERDSEAAGRAVDSLLNYETVKAFAAEARETERFDRALAGYAKAAVRSNTSLAALNVAQSFIMSAGLMAMVIAAGFATIDGGMGPGDVTAVILILMNLYAPLNILGFAYREIKQSAIDMEKMFSLLDEKLDIADAPDAKPLQNGPGALSFENVGFAHDGRVVGLTDVSFTVPPGATTAVVGPSGAGKSTVLKLALRFYDPTQGRVTIDGQDLRSVAQTSIREAVGLVPQDVVLFNDTIRYNIAYGKPDATQAELEQAARTAQLLTFIESLPDGWETKVGERGLKLSGGEKQRVGIARVALKQPRLLILDEATSSLDTRTEREVQAALEQAAKGRTTLVVAHRLSTIAGADQILVLKNGAIVERGRHADLILRNGEYAELWRRQAEDPPHTEASGRAQSAAPS